MTRFHCPIHGDQGNFIGVEVTLIAENAKVFSEIPKSLQNRARRRYCWCCWTDMMDTFMEPLKEIND